MLNERRLSLQPSQAKIPQTPFLNFEVTGLMFTKFSHTVAQLSPCDLFKAA